MPNPNTGDVNPAAEPQATPLTDTAPAKSVQDSGPQDKYGNRRDNKETEGGRENQEMTRKTRSAKNNDDPQDTSAKK